MRAHAWYNHHMKQQSTGFSALFELIGVLARRRYQIAERRFASLGLNHTEARLLTLLDEHHGEAMQDALSSMLFVDRSNAGRALKGLELRRYVERSKDGQDGRTNLVNMTEMGRRAASELNGLRREIAREFFGELTEDQANSIAVTLRTSMKLDQPQVCVSPDARSSKGERRSASTSKVTR